MFETEERTTTVHSRYQITDPICGQVDLATSLKKAAVLAQAHATEHSSLNPSPM